MVNLMESVLKHFQFDSIVQTESVLSKGAVRKNQARIIIKVVRL